MFDSIKCAECGRENLDDNPNWQVQIKRGRITSVKCPSCMTIDEFASTAYETESRGFIYDPVTDRAYSRPRDMDLPRITLRCPCGFVISDSGDDVQETFDEHRAQCAEAGGDDE